jgi:hypothetical protein
VKAKGFASNASIMVRVRITITTIITRVDGTGTAGKSFW